MKYFTPSDDDAVLNCIRIEAFFLNDIANRPNDDEGTLYTLLPIRALDDSDERNEYITVFLTDD
jgi:hypothetical protein